MPEVGLLRGIQEEKKIEWEIPDFLSLKNDNDEWTKSPTFDFANVSWYCSIDPEGDDDSSEGYIALYLYRDDKNRSVKEPPITVNYVLSIKGSAGQETVIDGMHTFKQNGSWGYSDFFQRSELENRKSELLPGDSLTILCELEVDCNRKQKASSMELIELEKLSENFMELLASKETCDTTLQVKDREFQAHRAVLIARSSVFAAMFQHKMSEKQTGVVPITDSDPVSFQEFLHYLYSGSIKNITFSSAYHLYITADKYDVQELKAFCLQYVRRSVTVDNVCDIVVLADEYNENELFAAAQSFFTNNMDKIFKTNNWKSLLKEKFQLVQKLLDNMASEIALLKKAGKSRKTDEVP